MEAFHIGMEYLKETYGDAFVLACGAPMLPSLGYADARTGADTDLISIQDHDTNIYAGKPVRPCRVVGRIKYGGGSIRIKCFYENPLTSPEYVVRLPIDIRWQLACGTICEA